MKVKTEKSGARLAATAGLGLVLAFGAAPAVAMANEADAGVEQAPVEQPTPEQDVDGAEGEAETDGAIIEVDSLESLKNAIQNCSAGDTIKLTADIALDARLAITESDITLDLNNKAITAADDFEFTEGDTQSMQLVSVDDADGVTIKNGSIITGWSNHHALNVWASDDVTLENLIIDHNFCKSGAALTVGASSVKIVGALSVVTGGYSWYGINVDSRAVNGVDTGASLTFDKDSVTSFSGATKTGLYVENSVETAGETGVSVTIPEGAQIYVSGSWWVIKNAAGDNATINIPDDFGFDRLSDGSYGKANATVDNVGYMYIDEAIEAAGKSESKTVVLKQSMNINGQLTIDEPITFDGGGNWMSFQGWPDYDHGGFFEIVSDNVTIKNFTIDAKLAKHGVYFDNVKNCALQNVTIDGGFETSVTVDSSGASISNCRFNPQAKDSEAEASARALSLQADGDARPLAAIRLVMSEGAESVPSLNLGAGNSLANEDVPLVSIDADSLTRIVGKGNLGAKPSDDAVSTYINGLINGEGDVDIYLNGEGASTENPEPSKPSNPGGGSSTVSKHKVTVADAEGGAVKVTPASAKKGDTVTIAATPDEGMKVAGVTVKDADGKEVEVEAGEEDGTWTFEMPGSAVTVEVAFADAWENPFSDVSESDWFYASVREANKLGLMKGYEGTDLFGPLSGAFREQAATVMWNWLGDGDMDAPEAPFADVLQGEWYAPYVNWANEAGVMTGYEGAGTFGVGDPLTREQFASMVARAAGADLDAADASALEGFGDADGVSGWAETAMAWAVENGVISGVELDDGSRALQATRSINRAEMVAMIVNAVQAGVVK